MHSFIVMSAHYLLKRRDKTRQIICFKVNIYYLIDKHEYNDPYEHTNVESYDF